MKSNGFEFFSLFHFFFHSDLTNKSNYVHKFCNSIRWSFCKQYLQCLQFFRNFHQWWWPSFYIIQKVFCLTKSQVITSAHWTHNVNYIMEIDLHLTLFHIKEHTRNSFGEHKRNTKQYQKMTQFNGGKYHLKLCWNCFDLKWDNTEFVY